MKRVISILLTLVMALSAFTACDTKKPVNEEPVSGMPADDAVMIKVGDYEITFGTLNDAYNSYYEMYTSYGMLNPENKEEIADFKEMLLNYQLENIIPAFAAEKLGIELNEEEERELNTMFDNQMISLLSQYDDQIDTSITDETMIYDAKLALFKDSLKKENIDYNEYIERQKKDMYLSVLSNKMLEEKVGSATVSDDEVKAEYDAQIKALQDEYAENVIAYYDDYQEVISGSASLPYVTPEGYYFISYIFVADKSEDIRDYDAKAILAEIDTKLTEIKKETDADKRIEAFKALITEYGQDPVLEMDPFAAEGMLVHPQMTTQYYEGFLAEALKLKNKGDISEPFRSETGTHIMIRLESLETGVQDFESVKETIKENMENKKQGELYEAAMAEWTELVNPVIKREYMAYFGMTEEDFNVTAAPDAGC